MDYDVAAFAGVLVFWSKSRHVLIGSFVFFYFSLLWLLLRFFFFFSSRQEPISVEGLSEEEQVRRQFMSPFVEQKDVLFVQTEVLRWCDGFSLQIRKMMSAPFTRTALPVLLRMLPERSLCTHRDAMLLYCDCFHFGRSAWAMLIAHVTLWWNRWTVSPNTRRHYRCDCFHCNHVWWWLHISRMLLAVPFACSTFFMSTSCVRKHPCLSLATSETRLNTHTMQTLLLFSLIMLHLFHKNLTDGWSELFILAVESETPGKYTPLGHVTLRGTEERSLRALGRLLLLLLFRRFSPFFVHKPETHVEVKI